MEFDKSRVFSAVNADELPIGSKWIFADTVKALRKKVQADEYAQYVQPFIRLHDNGGDVQFLADCYTYAYAYLIEPAREPKYKPFESVEKAMEAIKAHGGWVNDKIGLSYFVTAYDKKQTGRVIYINNWYSLQELPAFFTFTDDGSPCGEWDEE